MDTIHIHDIRVYGYTGALPEETVLGQWFRVDLSLQMDLSVAGASDQLMDTHDYCQAIAVVQHLVKTQPFQLIEALASAIAWSVLQQDERLLQVTVRLVKLTPPIPDLTGHVAVELTRDRKYLQSPMPQSQVGRPVQP